MSACQKIHNILDVVKEGLCTGCGVCTNACKAGAIDMHLGLDSYKPVVDINRCVGGKGCSRCLTVCPGKVFNIKTYADMLFHNIPEEHGLGRYIALYTGASTDDMIRFHSASGGMVTAFLLYLLDKKYISGAVVSTFCENDPCKANVIVARNSEDIIAARSSKYCPVSHANIYNSIVSHPGKCVIVGLPCHIHGFRKLAEKDKVFSEKIFGYFGLYCSSTRTSMLPKYLCYKYSVDPSRVKSFAFRDEGYPGYLKISTNDKEFCKVHFHDYYRKIRAFFNNRRCLLCFDQTAEYSDISFGDIHIPKYLIDDKGVNSLIVRNAYFDQLLRQAEEHGFVSLDTVSKDDVIESQSRMIYMKKQRIYAAFFIRKLFFKKVPDYGENFKGRVRLKDVLSVFCGLLQTCIGKRRYCWPFIEIIERVIIFIKR